MLLFKILHTQVTTTEYQAYYSYWKYFALSLFIATGKIHKVDLCHNLTNTKYNLNLKRINDHSSSEFFYCFKQTKYSNYASTKLEKFEYKPWLGFCPGPELLWDTNSTNILTRELHATKQGRTFSLISTRERPGPTYSKGNGTLLPVIILVLFVYCLI